jgi:hypothetical protein
MTGISVREWRREWDEDERTVRTAFEIIAKRK